MHIYYLQKYMFDKSTFISGGGRDETRGFYFIEKES